MEVRVENSQKKIHLKKIFPGVLETSASEAILVSMLAARSQAIKHIRETSGSSEDHDSVFLPKLVAYCSKEAHSSVEKAAMIALVQLRVLDTDGNCSLRGKMLQKVGRKLRHARTIVPANSQPTTSF